MVKTTKTKTYDTEKATVVRKVTFEVLPHPALQTVLRELLPQDTKW